MNKQQRNGIDQLLDGTIGGPTLLPEQRRRHREQLDEVAVRLERQRRSTGWRNFAELGFVSAAALIIVIAAVVVLTSRDDGSVDDQTVGVVIDDVVGVAQPLDPGEARHARFEVQADIRRDQGLTLMWSVERWERVTPDGITQEHVEVRDADGRQIASFTRNGDEWTWTQHDWTESGSGGVVNLPESIGIVTVEPTTAAEYLVQPPEGDVIEIERNEREEVIRYQLHDPEMLAWTQSEFGIEATSAVYELFREPKSGDLIETRYYLVTVEGEEVTLGRIEFVDLETMRSEDLDAALFALPDAATDELQYMAPAEQALPLGLTIQSHRQEFMASTETLVLTNDTFELELQIGPSTGGFDPRAFEATRASDVVTHSMDSAAGPVLWMEQRASRAPWVAYWDDGQYRFALSVTQSTSDDLWNETALKQLVEMLST